MSFLRLHSNVLLGSKFTTKARGNSLKQLLCIVIFILGANELSAAGFEAQGVGGGGWLYSGTYAPNSTSTMLIGSDMAGVHISYDSGEFWETHNEGLPLKSGAQSSYVQGMSSCNYQGVDHYFAATLGGIFHSQGGGPWSLETPASSFHYYSKIQEGTADNHQDTGLLPIHFSCIAQSNGIVVAGAGINRNTKMYGRDWDPISIDLNGTPALIGDNYTLYPNYPSLLDNDISYGQSSHGGQFTVWIKYLSGHPSGPTEWIPYDLDTGGFDENQFGAARDIDIQIVNGATYLPGDGIYS